MSSLSVEHCFTWLLKFCISLHIVRQLIFGHVLSSWTHPIFAEGMKTQDFKQKLKTCSFPKLPNSLADNFIRNISKIEYTERYSVNEALRHPWITRNQDDEIPLSVSQSIQGFNTSHLIADTFKFLFYLGQGEHTNTNLEDYKKKLHNFAEKHQQCRIRSPSYKKTRRKTNDTIMKLKELMISKEKDRNDEAKDNQYTDLQSPVLIKHQKLFLRLFDKNKIEDPIETLVVEQCEKLQDDSPKIFSESLNKEEESSSPILLGSNSFSTTRNNGISHYDVDLPLIKLNPDKKEKQKGGLRKLNSLREEANGKYEQNYSYFKNFGMKNSGEKNRDAVVSSKSKRVSYKFEPFNFPYPSKNTLKKPQTAERNKAASKNKQVNGKPFTFGMGSGLS